MEALSKIPTEVWVAIVGGVLAALGWFGRAIWETWRVNRLPYSQDRDRFQEQMASFSIGAFYYFHANYIRTVPGWVFDGIIDDLENIEGRKSDTYQDKSLATAEETLRKALDDFTDYTKIKYYPHSRVANAFTMLWDTYSEFDDEAEKRAQQIEETIMQKAQIMVSAFEGFRDAGQKAFSSRLRRLSDDA